MPLSVGDKLGHYEVLFGKVLKLDFVRAIFYMAKESLKDRIESGPIFGLIIAGEWRTIVACSDITSTALLLGHAKFLPTVGRY
jgi:hypothetical protein